MSVWTSHVEVNVNAFVILSDHSNDGTLLLPCLPPSFISSNQTAILFLCCNWVMFFTLTRGSQGPSVGKQRCFQCSPNTDAQEMGDSCGLHIRNFSAKPHGLRGGGKFSPCCLQDCQTPNDPWNNSTSYLRYGPASSNHQLLDFTTNWLYKRILRKNKILSTA